MKHFAAAIIASTVMGDHWLDFTVKKDGRYYDKILSPKDWSSAEVNYDHNEVTIMGNNSLFLRTYPYFDDWAIFKTYLRGGSIEYDVNVSQQQAGCVAGAYLVATDNGSCGEVDQNGTPQCRTIDVMQANRFGFSTQANPCSNGTCDAVSQCIASMHIQGVEDYGTDAYGPSGSMINTDLWFTVKNEFISDQSYQKFWKIRTTLTQGQDKITFEKDCRDYLDKLNGPIEGGMGFVFSNWDNSQGLEDFEIGDEPQGDCAASKSMIRYFSIRTEGSTEVIPEEPETSDDDEPPAPEPAQFEGFETYIESDDYTGDFTMFVKGIDGAELSTEGNAISMGCNNRAWITDFEEDESLYWAYWHDYLGGSLTFDVDLSGVACTKAAGLYLVQADDEDCSWGEKGDDVSPQCSRVEIMEANEIGFTTASYPCILGVCPTTTVMQQRTDALEYGPGGSLIDTSMPFTVKTRFFATADEEGMPTDLSKIETCLIQGENKITMVQDDPVFIAQMTSKVYMNMAVVISNWDAGVNNSISGEECNLEPSAQNRVGMDPGSKMSNLVWMKGDSIDGPALVIGEIASNVDDCDEPLCSGCSVAWYSDDIVATFNHCTDYTSYQYGNVCKSSKDLSLCGDTDDCFASWPEGDDKKWKSDDSECRPIPDRFVEGPFKWKKAKCSKKKGLCGLGCGDLKCKKSFPKGDKKRWQSMYSMCRCDPDSN